jgi:hypothetical protein
MARYRIVELAINPSHIVYEVEKHQWLWKWKFEELFSELQEAEAFIRCRIKRENESAVKTKRQVVREYSSDSPPLGPPPVEAEAVSDMARRPRATWQWRRRSHYDQARNNWSWRLSPQPLECIKGFFKARERPQDIRHPYPLTMEHAHPQSAQSY